MKVTSILQNKRPVVSFEFFPPKTDEGLKNLMETISSLKELSPSFVSMTYGAGGSTRAKTVELVSRIKHEIGLETVAHLTCVGHSQAELKTILTELQQRGVENILGLRGDPPKGQTTFVPAPDGFSHASQLVKFIRDHFPFCIGVAGYPEKHIESASLESDMNHLHEKVQAGGDFIVTQLFFDNAQYFSFSDRLKKMGVSVPVIAGIMPITDFEQIKRFASMCGASIPEALRVKMEGAGGDKSRVEQIGIDYATAQCVELLQKGIPGIHFYTLNKSHATREIFLALKKRGVVS
ncbi:MAG: 5,10-methylenetetrahydrofolate reductase [Elusimicrobia bacterium]|nr:5,10-methylenetetrahydrofolate reductase [Elusimicrobiota bacterium]